MSRVLMKASLGVWLAAASASGALAWEAQSADPVVQQRIDTEEVLLPPAPTGPATPVPFCSPSSPICP